MTNRQNNEKFKEYTKVLQLDTKYHLQDQDKKKVQSFLQQSVQYLVDKKKREKQKKKRIKQIEEEFQRKRREKIQQFQEKSKLSQKAKSNATKDKLEKNKKALQYAEKIFKKARSKYNETIQKGLQKRKQFYPDLTQKSARFNSKAESQQDFKRQSQARALNQSKLNRSQTLNQIEIHSSIVHDQMRQIEEKISKANNNLRLYQQQTTDRLYQKDRHNSQIKQKIRSHSLIEQQKNLIQVYGKNEHIIGAGQKIRGMTQKHLSDRKKSCQEKIKKLHQNIKHLESEKQQKFATLETKFSKIYEPQPYSRTTIKQKNQREKVLLNHIKQQEEKKKKADEILKKHSEITARNKIYKEKKDLIFQTIQKVNQQVNE